MESKFKLGNTEVVVVDRKVSCIIRGNVKVTNNTPGFKDKLIYLFVTAAIHHTKKLSDMISSLTPINDYNVCAALQVLNEFNVSAYLTEKIDLALGCEKVS